MKRFVRAGIRGGIRYMHTWLHARIRDGICDAGQELGMEFGPVGIKGWNTVLGFIGVRELVTELGIAHR